MNRSNVGNQVTNGAQILSVGATTASKVFNLGKAETALNNLDETEQSDFFQMKANKMRDETAAYNNKEIKEDSVDNIMGGSSFLKDNSEQIKSINTKITRDSEFFNHWTKSLKSELEPLDKLIKEVR